MLLRRIFYVSRAAPDLGVEQVRHLVAAARRHNWREQVTGCLLFTGTSFAQALEGRPCTLDTVLARIRDDARHGPLRVLCDETTEHRRYADWAMGLVCREDLAGRIDSLLGGDTPAPAEIRALIEQLDIDPVVGAI